MLDKLINFVCNIIGHDLYRFGGTYNNETKEYREQFGCRRCSKLITKSNKV